MLTDKPWSSSCSTCFTSFLATASNSEATFLSDSAMGGGGGGQRTSEGAETSARQRRCDTDTTPKQWCQQFCCEQEQRGCCCSTLESCGCTRGRGDDGPSSKAWC